MTDIVERLAKTYDMYPQDVSELRAEIERLRYEKQLLLDRCHELEAVIWLQGAAGLKKP